jgi:hypothetical protein
LSRLSRLRPHHVRTSPFHHLISTSFP